MKLSRRSTLAIVAISALLISTILLIMVAALLFSLRNEKHIGLREAHSTAALFLAEAGITDAKVQISTDNSWAPTTALTVDFPDNGGRYTIVFNDGGTVEPHESVNNLAGDTAVDGPRGLGTVPAHTLDLVVTANAKGTEVRYEALLSRGFSNPPPVPMLTSGKIILEGSVEVTGIESLTNPVDIPAGIHSNSLADNAGVIQWDGGGQNAQISGDVTTSSSHPSAIETTGGTFNANNIDTGRDSLQFPSIDVDAAISSGAGAATMVPATGGTTLLSGQDYQFSGGVVNGDLKLDGVNLYVDGDLEVNGSISGTGAIYVKGDTSFRGSTHLTVGENQSLALVSKGNVKLEGFDGDQFLDSLAASDPAGFGKWNEDAKWAHEQLEAIVSNPSNYTTDVDLGDTWGNSDGNRLDQLRRVIGQDTGSPSLLPPGREPDTLEKMISFLAGSYSGNETADFLIQRLTETRSIYRAKQVSGLSFDVLAGNYVSKTGDYSGILDALNDNFYPAEAAVAAAEVQLQNFDKLGSSYFQGLIYSNGAVYASNEVEIVGALMVEKTTGSPSGLWSVGGEDLEAGDVFLSGGTGIIYNKELMEDPFAGSPSGPVTVVSWFGN